MKEIRKNHIVQLLTSDGIKIDGIVFDYESDRVSVLIAYDSLILAQKINELESINENKLEKNRKAQEKFIVQKIKESDNKQELYGDIYLLNGKITKIN